MKILFAADGSMYSEMAVNMLQALELRPQTEITVTTVVPEHTFLGGLTLQRLRGKAVKEQIRKAHEEGALQMLHGFVETLREIGLEVETVVAWGSPAEQILELARDTRADLIVIGAKGLDNSPRFPLGSVAQKVMKYADTSVLLAREKRKGIRRVLLATDGSKHSDAAARFLLDLPLPKKSKVFLVTSLESHVAALLKMPTLDLETNWKILLELQAAEEQAAKKLTAKTEGLFRGKNYYTETMVLRGEPAHEILMAAKTLNPDLVVVGAKGLTGIETFLLGSVAQRVARFSRYSVLIVRARKR